MDTKASARQRKTVVEIQNGNLRNHYESTPVKYGEPPVEYCLRNFTGQAKKRVIILDLPIPVFVPSCLRDRLFLSGFTFGYEL
jgi:hypothetical protein